jgi:virulence factor
MIEIWSWCLENGLSLYIEKPMGLNLHQARMLAYAAEKKGVITQVGHQRRSAPIMVRMREACLAKGPLTHAVCEFYKNDQAPYTTVRDHMLDDGSHAVDTVRWMCGGEVASVESTCRRVGTPDINWIGITIHFRNEATVRYDTREVAGSTEFHVFAGFQAKSREFVDSLRTGRDCTSSPFRDAVKTMEVVERVLGQAAIRDA